MAQKHLIGKQIVQVGHDATEDAYAIQHKISQWIQKDLTPAIAHLFDSMVDEDSIVRFDTIEIDIEHVDIDGDMNGMIEKVIRGLKENIKDRLHNIHTLKNVKKPTQRELNQRFLDAKRNSFLKDNPLNGEKTYDKNGTYSKSDQNLEKNIAKRGDNDIAHNEVTVPEKEVSQSRRKHYFNIWLHWLEKGSLPSYTLAPDEHWVTKVLETLGVSSNAVTILENKLKQYPVALHRLVLQHLPKDLKSIVELYTGFPQRVILEMFQEIKLIFQESTVVIERPTSIRSLEIKIWKKIFDIVILKRQKLDSISIGKAAMKYLIDIRIISEVELRKLIFNSDEDLEKNITYSTISEILQGESIIGKEEESPVSEKKPKHKGIEIPTENETSIAKDEVEYTKDKDINTTKNEEELAAADNVTQDNQITKTSENIDEEEIFKEEALESPQYFNNAGMVLLNPFLSNFFNRLGLTEGTAFKNFKAKSKAVLLLHFLATGQEQPKEYDMVLPKFLCEMPANMPLDHTLEITKKEKEEAIGLLKVIVEHWEAIGEVSADGLREGFLMRQGKLEKEATGWKLYVEQKTMDILLDRLPWNISMIKLPWMKEMLKVEWR